MESSFQVRELLVFLVAAGVFVPLLQYLKLGIVLGFLIAGIVVGPGGFGHLAEFLPWLRYATIEDPKRLQSFGDFGILCLLFTIGLELSFDRLGALGRVMISSGAVQIGLTMALVFALSAATGHEFDDSLVFGMALALSSTAIVRQSLVERRRLGGPVARTTLGVLILQDLMVVPIVIVVTNLGRKGAEVLPSLLQGIGIAAVVVVVVLVAGRYLIRPVMRVASVTGNRTLVIAITLLLIVGIGAMTAAAGLSSALGAFLAGLLLSETEYRHQLDVEIEPFKDLLLGLFFMTVGMTIDVAEVLRSFPVILSGLVALLAVKIAAAGVASLLSRGSRGNAVEAAFLLAGAGEFAFVVLTLAAQEQVVEGGLVNVVTTIAALSMLVTPFLGAIGAWIGERIDSRRTLARDGASGDEAFSDHVIIGGFGRFGATIASLLEAEEIPYVGLDLDEAHVRRAKRLGKPVFYGDATRAEVLARVGADKARAFVVTPDESAIAETMVAAIHAVRPEVPIHARARGVRHARTLRELGATDVVPEALEGSLQLAGRLLADIGLPEEAIDRRLAAARQAAQGRLDGDDLAGPQPVSEAVE